jgi:hypothetical protein
MVLPAKKNDSRRRVRLALRSAEREREALESLDDLAVSHALQRGDLAPVVRYLREIVAPLIKHRIRGQICSTATVELLADMLEGRESIPWHLKWFRSRRGKPTDVAGTAFKNIDIGRWIAARLRSGAVRKAVVADACAAFNIESAHASKCLQWYKKYCFHNKRCEPMPLDRPPRKVKKGHLKPN